MLEVSKINVFYEDIHALWEVSLSVGQGEMVSLIGANGAGKSTIVEAIAGLLPLRGGQVSFAGQRLDLLPAHKVVEAGVSLVLEERGIFPGMNVLENLELGAFLPGARAGSAQVFEAVYSLFPILADRGAQAAGTLSGGEQQMLAIGRAMMSNPKLLMLDEPSLGLAPLIVKNIFKAVKDINESGTGVLLVEQNVRAALELADRAYVLENGRITNEGEGRTLLDDESVLEAYLGA